MLLSTIFLIKLFAHINIFKNMTYHKFEKETCKKALCNRLFSLTKNLLILISALKLILSKYIIFKRFCELRNLAIQENTFKVNFCSSYPIKGIMDFRSCAPTCSLHQTWNHQINLLTDSSRMSQTHHLARPSSGERYTNASKGQWLVNYNFL